MHGGKVCAWTSRAAVIAALALAAACAGDRGSARPADPQYLAAMPSGSTLDFRITFARYRVDEQTLADGAWAETTEPEAEVASLWQANGLRIGSADRDKAKAVHVILKRMATVSLSRRELVVSPTSTFEVKLGARVPSVGLVYKTSEAASYGDVTDLQTALRILPMRSAAGDRFSVTPAFHSGADAALTVIKGATAVLPAVEGEAILIGPAADAPAGHLGSALYETDREGQWCNLLIIEPRLE